LRFGDNDLSQTARAVRVGAVELRHGRDESDDQRVARMTSAVATARISER
jgi:hypothetical protein